MLSEFLTSLSHLKYFPKKSAKYIALVCYGFEKESVAGSFTTAAMAFPF